MASKNSLTEGEMKILSSAWQCFKTVPEIDYKKLATLVGHANPVSTSNAWARIKKKLEAMSSSAGDSGDSVDTGLPSPSATTPLTTKPKTVKKETAKNGAGKAKETPIKSAAGQKRKAEGPLVKKEEDGELSDDEAQPTPKQSTGKKSKNLTGSNIGIGKENTTATGGMNNRAGKPDTAEASPGSGPGPAKKDNKSGTSKAANGNKKPKLDHNSNTSTGKDGSESGSDNETPKKTPNGHAADKFTKPTKGKGKAADKKGNGKGASPASGEDSPVRPVTDTKAPNKQAWQVGKDNSILKPHSLAGQVFPNLRDHSIVDDDGQPIDEDGNVLPEIETNGIDRFGGRGLRHHERAEIDGDGNPRIFSVKKDGTRVYEDEYDEDEADGADGDALEVKDEAVLDEESNGVMGMSDDHEESMVHAV